ncbi:hypothetical protein KY285_006718 [Solanum tuberosum]|nr:hypothetical protein KY285_006718 [Solanum tuberosum]
MARSFILWLHGLGDSGPANEPIKGLFTSPQFKNTKWSFPSAPSNSRTQNGPSLLLPPIQLLATKCQRVRVGFSKSSALLENPTGVQQHFLESPGNIDGSVMPSWFDIHELPVSDSSPKDESDLLKAVKNVHAMIDKEIEAGTNPNNVFVCGFSQGGALTLASVLLYPKTLGGGAVFSGWVPFNASILEQQTPEAKKTPILWSHGMADKTVLFEAGQAGPPFLERAGMTCEFKAYPRLAHSINNEELKNLESWIKTRLQSNS